LGVDRLAEGGMVLRARMRVAAMDQIPVRRALLRRIGETLRADGIRLPTPAAPPTTAPVSG